MFENSNYTKNNLFSDNNENVDDEIKTQNNKKQKIHNEEIIDEITTKNNGKNKSSNNNSIQNQLKKIITENNLRKI